MSVQVTNHYSFSRREFEGYAADYPNFQQA